MIMHPPRSRSTVWMNPLEIEFEIAASKPLCPSTFTSRMSVALVPSIILRAKLRPSSLVGATYWAARGPEAPIAVPCPASSRVSSMRVVSVTPSLSFDFVSMALGCC